MPLSLQGMGPLGGGHCIPFHADESYHGLMVCTNVELVVFTCYEQIVGIPLHPDQVDGGARRHACLWLVGHHAFG